MLDLLNENGFQFWVPLTISKSQAEGPDQDPRRWIEGIASTDDTDLQDEIVKQIGIDFSYFLKYGYYNNDHKPGFENKVGQPTEAKITSKGLWTKGYLFKNHKVADAIWELANSLEASDSRRKLGFSIQGKVLRRAGKTILKCWIQDIAITAAPINTNTWLDVVKSLNSLPVGVWGDGEYEITPDMANKAMRESEGRCCGGCNCSGGAKDRARKALAPTPGISTFSIPQEDQDLFKKDKEKALAAAPMQVESLEDRMTDLGPGHSDPKHKTTKKSLPTLLSFEESVAWLQAYRNLSQPQAQIVAKAVFHMNGL
jgi:hypothetical protein